MEKKIVKVEFFEFPFYYFFPLPPAVFCGARSRPSVARESQWEELEGPLKDPPAGPSGGAGFRKGGGGVEPKVRRKPWDDELGGQFWTTTRIF